MHLLCIDLICPFYIHFNLESMNVLLLNIQCAVFLQRYCVTLLCLYTINLLRLETVISTRLSRADLLRICIFAM